MERKKRILFVCSANTCRSPVAEAILREYGGDRYDAASAGLFAHDGEPMMASCVAALSALFGREVDPVSHRSARLTKEMLRDSDMAVAVSEGYAALLRTCFPEYSEKITALPEGISDISRLSGEELMDGVRRIRDGISVMFLENKDEN